MFHAYTAISFIMPYFDLFKAIVASGAIPNLSCRSNFQATGNKGPWIVVYISQNALFAAKQMPVLE